MLCRRVRFGILKASLKSTNCEVLMPKRGKKMLYEERLACIQQVKLGLSDAQIAQESGWSRWAVRKWRRAYLQRGKTGLAPQMGRPSKGVLSSYPAQLRTDLKHFRQTHPGWGPLTLIEELLKLPAYEGVALPSRARIAAFLKEQSLVRRYEHHAGVPNATPAEPLWPHTEWEMDAQGQQTVVGLGKVSIVNLIDVVSRLKVESYPHVWGNGLDWQDYQLVLRCAFVQYGLPQRITLDHDSAFFDNTSLSPFPSRLHLWLVGLGVEVVFITQPPPLQHAIIERGHQTMSAQTIQGQTWTSQRTLWQGLAQRREFLNGLYPSRTLAYRSPLEVFPEAAHSGRDYRPEWEGELLDLEHIYTFLSGGSWYRETNLHGEFWLGMQRYNAGVRGAHTTQEIVFDPVQLEFMAKTTGTENMRRFPAKGLTKIDLMGELLPITRFPNYQLALPLSRQEWRQNQLVKILRGTTI